MRSSKRIVFLTVTLLLPAPALANDYVPDDQRIQKMASAIEPARMGVSGGLMAFSVKPAGGEYSPIIRVKAGLSRVLVTDQAGRTTLLALDRGPISVSFSTLFSSANEITIGNVTLSGGGGFPQATTKLLIDEMTVMGNLPHALSTPENTEFFAGVVKNYRQAQPKPQLPEDARRFEVQAKGAVKDGDFGGAALYYEKALQVAPWWPGGHFDMAAVLAEMGEYPVAIVQMQRYLQLAPDAPDARASQDNIYEWERKEDQDKAAAASPAPPAKQNY